MNEPRHHPSPSRSDEAIDEFESIFKRAERTPYRFADISLESIAIVTDADQQAADTLIVDLKRFLPQIANTAEWVSVTGDQFRNVNDLLHVMNNRKTDLIVTSRCLAESSLVPQHTLGVYVDVMTQKLSTPLLLLPGTAPQPHPLVGTACRGVMVVTDNLSGDDRLVNHAVSCCDPNGTVWLCHVEDDLLFRRYLDAIRRIPQINTEQAQELIAEQLVAIPTHYAESCIRGLKDAGVDLNVEQIVEFGHRVARYRDLVSRYAVDLLVTNTKDKDQLAMHGMAYALSVELTDVAQLLL
jgi:nucleotide-binding universal stress UspA family protein